MIDFCWQNVGIFIAWLVRNIKHYHLKLKEREKDVSYHSTLIILHLICLKEDLKLFICFIH